MLTDAAGDPYIRDDARAHLSIVLHVRQFAFQQKPGEDREEGNSLGGKM